LPRHGHHLFRSRRYPAVVNSRARSSNYSGKCSERLVEVPAYHYVDLTQHRATFAAKTERLKQAKDEAEKEILSYKAEKEAEFQRKMSDDTSISHDNALKMAQQADTEVSQVRDSVGQKRQNVLDLLIKHVRSVKF
jgi:V-type H+-transporting ATPase subunit G